MKVSIVIPVYNEEDNILPLFSSINHAMQAYNDNYEVIFVDDGSSDSTLEKLINLSSEYKQVTAIALRRNFGQTASLSAGFDHANGDVIIAMDGDLQNDPEDIPSLLKGINEGYDIVSGWRKNRKDKMIMRKIPSRIANWLISKITGVHLHDYGCTLKAYKPEVLKNIRLYGEMHRFIPALASWNGAKIKEIPVNHRSRKYGISKYGIWRTFRVVLDLLTVKFMLNFFTRPLHMLGGCGIVFLGLGTGYGLYLALQRLLFDAYIKPLRPLIVVLLMITGIQLLTIGLVAEINVRTYFESQNKNIYTVKNIYD